MASNENQCEEDTETHLKMVPQERMQIRPNLGAKCTIYISCQEGVTSILNVELNTRLDHHIGPLDSVFNSFVNECLLSMFEGEVLTVCIPDKVLNIVNKDREEMLQECSITINLLSVERGKDILDFTMTDHLEHAFELKKIGTKAYQEGNLPIAFFNYSQAVKHLICMGKKDDIPKVNVDEVLRLKSQCYLNLAACQLSEKNYDSVTKNCTSALIIDPSNVKGLYRRGQAYNYLRVFDKAVIDFQEALKVEPGNKAIGRSLRFAEEELLKQNSGLASSMRKMFVN